MVTTHFRALVTAISRTPTSIEVTTALREMETLREKIINQLEMQLKTKNMIGNPFQNDRHIQSSNPESNSEREPANEQERGENSEPGQMTPKTAMTRQRRDQDGKSNSPTATTGGGGQNSPSATGKMKAFPLALMLQACPEIIPYGSGGAISSWRNLMAAAVVVRSMLGVSPDAYQQACEILGPENAATVIACILERAGHINSAGGYLRT